MTSLKFNLIASLFIASTFLLLYFSATVPSITNPEGSCNLDQKLIEEIRSYQPIADLIIELVVRGEFKGRAYNELAKFVDNFPKRLAGSEGLESAIDYIMEKMRRDGIEKVWDEPVQVREWKRGSEKAEILSPIRKELRVLGLAPTPGTPPEGITGEVVVVHNYTELEGLRDSVRGKIVVYNSGWLGSYGKTVIFRRDGAIKAGELGAVAALVESVTPFSLDTPHTGVTSYSLNVTQIPFASITREDAELLSRMYGRGEKILIKLTLLDTIYSNLTTTRNSFGEISGRELADEKVAVSGHIDAWDVGQGAQDDGGGVIISAEALAVISYLGLKPRRSLQAIFWTDEEQNGEGEKAFVERHGNEFSKYKAVFEADLGTFRPRGIEFAGSPEAGCFVQEILGLLTAINATEFARLPVVGSDIHQMLFEGVPGLQLMTENEKYFYYHHSNDCGEV